MRNEKADMFGPYQQDPRLETCHVFGIGRAAASRAHRTPWRLIRRVFCGSTPIASWFAYCRPDYCYKNRDKKLRKFLIIVRHRRRAGFSCSCLPLSSALTAGLDSVTDMQVETGLCCDNLREGFMCGFPEQGGRLVVRGTPSENMLRERV